MEELQKNKQRFGIIGNAPSLNRAIEVAMQVAPTDLSVLITGESGVGKEVFPQIIHQNSNRKHGSYIAVNCGAIPEGTIDSELFGHEKGSFTGASDSRKGYFEVAHGGTIFLDEVADLPMPTQVRLLRVLETGEFIKVGASKVMKSNVRVIAATNVNISEFIARGRFREDLYYRLNTVPIFIQPLRDRKEDIYLLFRKFAADFAETYRMPAIQLTDDAQQKLVDYHWPGNIRQLKNITEQISVIERQRIIHADVLQQYLPVQVHLPVLYGKGEEKTFASEMDIYNTLVEMRKDITALKRLVAEIMHQNTSQDTPVFAAKNYVERIPERMSPVSMNASEIVDTQEIQDESLSIAEREADLIGKALEKYGGRRRTAAKELGISERTLYRKIKEYNLEDI
jgi:transcriptional regulator with PAS, ATPase and Fis domain